MSLITTPELIAYLNKEKLITQSKVNTIVVFKTKEPREEKIKSNNIDQNTSHQASSIYEDHFSIPQETLENFDDSSSPRVKSGIIYSSPSENNSRDYIGAHLLKTHYHTTDKLSKALNSESCEQLSKKNKNFRDQLFELQKNDLVSGVYCERDIDDRGSKAIILDYIFTKFPEGGEASNFISLAGTNIQRSTRKTLTVFFDEDGSFKECTYEEMLNK